MSSPGSNERFLAKAPTVPADMSFLDLEDSVAPLEKEAARAKVADAVKNLPWDDRVLCVRINAWDTEWTYGDVIEVVGNAGERLDELMLPKVQTAAEVVALDLLLSQVEKKSGLPVGHIGIEAQIETTRGLINVEEICAASPRLETIIFGPADFAASMEMPVLTGGVAIPEYPGDHFNYVFSKILMAGRANGLQVIDGPFLKVRELDALAEFSQRTRVLGYDGKWALTPDQVGVLNRGVLAHPGAVRPGLGHPRRLSEGDRGRPVGCGHVRRRDDRRGFPQDGHQIRRARRAGRAHPFGGLSGDGSSAATGGLSPCCWPPGAGR
jgi:citrate lyase subunit beta/citryl-CoA lyase